MPSFISKAGFATLMSYSMVVNLRFATGITKFEMRNAMMEMQKDTTNKGLINRNNEIPADFMATNSKLSPRLPKVMMEEIKIASGNANGIAVAVTYAVSSKMLVSSNPLPTKSSIYFQKNCITNTKRVMKKVAMKGPTKDFKISLSSFLIMIGG